MSGFVLTGNDTTTLKSASEERIIVDFAGAEPVVITFENDLATIETGKNGNSIIAPNKMGDVATAAISLEEIAQLTHYLQENSLKESVTVLVISLKKLLI